MNWIDNVRATKDNISRNWVGRGYLVAVTGSTWLLRGLHSAFSREHGLAWLLRGIHAALFFREHGLVWLLRGLCDCYGVYIPLFFPRAWPWVAVTGSTWLLRGIRPALFPRAWPCVAVTGYISHSFFREHGLAWLLRGIHPALIREHGLVWLLRDISRWRCDRGTNLKMQRVHGRVSSRELPWYFVVIPHEREVQ